MSPVEAEESRQGPPAANDSGSLSTPYRSFKKKYFKMRNKLRKLMIDSNALYEQEENAKRVARRLREQIDQLLELILDLNDSNIIEPHLKYDLREISQDETRAPPHYFDKPSTDQEVLEAHAALAQAKVDLEAGRLSTQDFKEKEADLRLVINQPRSLGRLSRISHTEFNELSPRSRPADVMEDSPVGYLSPLHEDEYLSVLDNHLEDLRPGQDPLPPSTKPPEREREREASIHNPVSTFNWLSKNRPKFLEDENLNHEKATRSTRRTSPKPEKPSSQPLRVSGRRTSSHSHGDDLFEDDGNAIEMLSEDAGGSHKKRKRGRDDDAYRPKGGGNRKRKRPSGRSSISTAQSDHQGTIAVEAAVQDN